MSYPQQPGQQPYRPPHPNHQLPPRQPRPYAPPQHNQPYQAPQVPRPPVAAPHGAPGQLPAGAGGIAVTTRFFPLGFMLALVKPKVFIDNYEMPPASWGRTMLPAQPGRHHVHVHIPYFLPPKIGPADAVVDVHPGHIVELEYRAPAWSFSAGSLGPPPQSYNGLGITIAVMVVPFALVLFFLIVMVLLHA
ncbi:MULTISPECIES: hypothetical protein [Mycobacterium]|uniref:Uncharacterized protein n=1 Tax=Mycobacterium kiyosense TaxID=2871094 RepID=A0A9P3Q8I8_9MYCO|nr:MULTISPECIES: hypothetical protein [Mycobacterium]BDE13700.1 hypothetical protein MKCMC460_25600 [Mycobacterium sp. 20KCMC460]GLB84473.1 hypothetical protein SRL2020028_37290 [Mycobacterium kiyosense]GLB89056.1 hypothetical protein SRL2020130_18730 [Mycobacterium kiyosense]GLB94340.1 hypothetical protein SRL2020226_11160 [Mycobacterium kiyosense]GLC00980.1 hypothetical protein SRL2020400_15710 [Mycobacterium kiyosense]